MQYFVVGPLANIKSCLMNQEISLLQSVLVHSSEVYLQRLFQAALVELVPVDELLEMVVILQRLEVEFVGLVVLPSGARLDRLIHLHLYTLAERLHLYLGLATGR